MPPRAPDRATTVCAPVPHAQQPTHQKRAGGTAPARRGLAGPRGFARLCPLVSLAPRRIQGTASRPRTWCDPEQCSGAHALPSTSQHARDAAGRAGPHRHLPLPLRSPLSTSAASSTSPTRACATLGGGRERIACSPAPSIHHPSRPTSAPPLSTTSPAHALSKTSSSQNSAVICFPANHRPLSFCTVLPAPSWSANLSSM